MRTITEDLSRRLQEDLRRASQELREHGAMHLYRAGAWRAGKDPIMTRYHRDQAEQVHALATTLRQLAQALADRPKTLTPQAKTRAALSPATTVAEEAHSAA